MPAISVIVPVYKVEEYLPRCIDSILAQTFADFELILVDDGSPDRSGAICEEYAIKDNRIRVIHKQNGGLSDARNTGIAASRGAYLSFIDSDDWVAPSYLEVLHHNLVSSDADISAVALRKEYDDHSQDLCAPAAGRYSGLESLSFLYHPATIYTNVACAKLYKRRMFQTLRYPLGKLHEDGLTTYKLLYQAKYVFFSDAPLYYYYQRSDSIMNDSFSERRIDEYSVYLERAEFFTSHGLTDLLRSNESTKLACIKTLSCKLIHSKLPCRTKNKWLNIFRADIRKHFSLYEFRPLSSQYVATWIYCVSPRLFCLLSALKNR